MEKSVVDRRKEEVLMRRKQTEEDVLWETFLIRKQEQEGKRRKVAEEVLAPAAKKARVVETELPKAERKGKDGEDDDILVDPLPVWSNRLGKWSWMQMKRLPIVRLRTIMNSLKWRRCWSQSCWTTWSRNHWWK